MIDLRATTSRLIAQAIAQSCEMEERQAVVAAIGGPGARKGHKSIGGTNDHFCTEFGTSRVVASQ